MIREIIKNSLLLLWQLPQFLLSLLISLILDIMKKVISVEMYKERTYVIINVPNWSISFGPIVLIDQRYSEVTWEHEYGHCIQSLWWGPLYLIVIVIPSVIFNNLWDRLFHKKWEKEECIKWYYNRYPEKQADKLSDVKRGTNE